MVTIVSTFFQSIANDMTEAWLFGLYNGIHNITDSREDLTASNLTCTLPVQVMM